MANRFRTVTRVLFFTAALVYPAMFFYFLVIRQTGLRTLSLFVMALALVVFVSVTSKKKANENLSRFFGIPSSC